MQASRLCVYAIAVGASIALILPSMAKRPSKHLSGEQVFKQYCASCHLGGGNRVKAHHPVAGSKQLATMATFKSYLSDPPGHMPYYQMVVKDEKTMQALYDYCKKLPAPPIDSASL